MALCLIIEDDAPQRSVLSATLEAEGYQVVEAENGAIARELCSKRVPELILLDLGLPDTDGLKLIPDLRVSSPLSRIVVLTGRNSVADAVTALRTGARHYLLKPWDLEELLLVVEREIRAVDFAEAQQRCDDSNIAWGSHPGMTRLRTQLGKLSLSPMTPVLIEGETGSGKEVMARELHRMSASDGPFVAMNCASIPSGLMESELFGHERGAFTSADRRRRGLAELARNGTLFLDEIGEMAPALQAKLLRFLQDFRFRRVGGEEELESRCRIIAATHRNLEEMEREGQFRLDLFFRLSVVKLRIPPLRERREDLLPLASLLLTNVAKSLGRGVRPLGPEAERLLVEHSWRGNVRELRNRLERALVLADGDHIGPEDLDLVQSTQGSGPFEGGGDEASSIRRLLEEEGWNLAKAARRRGVPRHWLRYRMTKYGIKKPKR